MLNCKCLLCAVTSFLFPTAKIGIFVISSLQKAIFFALKYAKTFPSLVDMNKKSGLEGDWFFRLCIFAPVFKIK